jgi:hypothetical protein
LPGVPFQVVNLPTESWAIPASGGWNLLSTSTEGFPARFLMAKTAASLVA